MYTRSQVPKAEREKIEKDKQQYKLNLISTAPFIKYHGKIIYCTTFIDCAEAGDSLLNCANKRQELFIVGFDMEWSFNYQTGPGKTAVIQISPSLDLCYVLHVSEIKSLPKTITEFISHDNVRLTGINIKNDIRKLARDFKGVNGDKGCENCIDLGPLANSVSDFSMRWSMEKLVEHFLKMRISKDKSVRMSNWHIIPLSRAQKVYAAIDAHVSLKLYRMLKDLESIIKLEETLIKSSEQETLIKSSE